MSPEAQRIAIAEACGWHMGSSYSASQLYRGDELISHDDEHGLGIEDFAYFLPDYLSDLNAMHEAEKTLTDAQHETFRHFLRTIVIGDSKGPWERDFISNEANQRAEAFLRTINKLEAAA